MCTANETRSGSNSRIPIGATPPRLSGCAKRSIDGPSERVIPGVPDTSFRREWKHFADCILQNQAPRTPLAGGLADLDLAVALIQAMPPKDIL